MCSTRNFKGNCIFIFQERRGRLDLSGTGTVHLLQSIVSLFSDTRATSSVDSRRLWSELGIRIVELTVYITSQENRVRVLRSVSSLVAHKKVPPDAYFILGNFCIYPTYISSLFV